MTVGAHELRCAVNLHSHPNPPLPADVRRLRSYRHMPSHPQSKASRRMTLRFQPTTKRDNLRTIDEEGTKGTITAKRHQLVCCLNHGLRAITVPPQNEYKACGNNNDQNKVFHSVGVSRKRPIPQDRYPFTVTPLSMSTTFSDGEWGLKKLWRLSDDPLTRRAPRFASFRSWCVAVFDGRQLETAGGLRGKLCHPLTAGHCR